MPPSDPSSPQTDPASLPGEELEPIDDRWLDVIDAALTAQAPLARRWVERLRRTHPEATDRQLLEIVTRRFTALTTATGAGIGGTAALPGLGTVTALGLTVGEGITFAEACAVLTLAAADIHGVDMTDPHTRRLVLLAVLSGERGAEIISKAMGRRGVQWGAVLGGRGGIVPDLVSRQLSRYLRRRLMARTGGLWIGRLLPFGLGAVIGGIGARAVSRSVVEAMQEIFSHHQLLEGEISSHRTAPRP